MKLNQFSVIPFFTMSSYAILYHSIFPLPNCTIRHFYDIFMNFYPLYAVNFYLSFSTFQFHFHSLPSSSFFIFFFYLIVLNSILLKFIFFYYIALIPLMLAILSFPHWSLLFYSGLISSLLISSLLFWSILTISRSASSALCRSQDCSLVLLETTNACVKIWKENEGIKEWMSKWWSVWKKESKR